MNVAETTVTVELVGPTHISVVTREPGQPVHRRSLVPGRFVDGKWSATDLWGESKAVQALAKEVWTKSTVTAFRDAADDANAESDRRLAAAEAARKAEIRAVVVEVLAEQAKP